MSDQTKPSLDEISALRAIVEGTAGSTGEQFFQSLVRNLASTTNTHYAFIAEFVPPARARTIAFWVRDHIDDNVEWDLRGGGAGAAAVQDAMIFRTGEAPITSRD